MLRASVVVLTLLFGGAAAAADLKVELDPTGADVMVNGKKVGRTPLVIKTDGQGPWKVRLTLKGHVAHEETVQPGTTDLKVELVRERTIVTETKIEILEPINFAPGRSDLPPRSFRMLDVVATSLIGIPDKNVEVQGHAAEGEPDADKVALARAEVVVKYLVGKGVAPKRLTAKSLGATAVKKRTVTFKVVDPP